MRSPVSLVTVCFVSATEWCENASRAQSWTVPFSASAVHAARSTVATKLRGLDAADAVVEDARVVVSELLGNALRHARPLPDGTLRIGLVVEDHAVRLFVVVGGSATLPTLLTPPPLSAGGRGLAIVSALSHDWGVRETGAGNTVFGVLRLG